MPRCVLCQKPAAPGHRCLEPEPIRSTIQGRVRSNVDQALKLLEAGRDLETAADLLDLASARLRRAL